jgi:hypothetical protein
VSCWNHYFHHDIVVDGSGLFLEDVMFSWDTPSLLKAVRNIWFQGCSGEGLHHRNLSQQEGLAPLTMSGPTHDGVTLWQDDDGDYVVLLTTVQPNVCFVLLRSVVHPRSDDPDDIYDAVIQVLQNYYDQLREESQH